MRLAVACVGVIAALALSPRVGLAQTPDGAAVFKANCAGCHGQDGVPMAAMAKMFKNLKAFTDPATLRGISEDSVLSIVEHGIAPGMRSFKGKLSKEQESAVAKYVKGLAKKG
jgi:mono/diheme cytochrome c family protein